MKAIKAIFAALFAAALGCAFVRPVAAADAAKFKEKVVYSFCANQNCADGARPAV